MTEEEKFNKAVLDELGKFPYVRAPHVFSFKQYTPNPLRSRSSLIQETDDRIDRSYWWKLNLLGRTNLPLPAKLRFKKPSVVQMARKGEWYFDFSRYNVLHELGHLAEIPKEKVIEWSFFSDEWFLGGSGQTEYMTYENIKREVRALVYQNQFRIHFEKVANLKEKGRFHQKEDFTLYLWWFGDRVSAENQKRLIKYFDEFDDGMTEERALADLRERLGILSDELVCMNENHK